MKIKEIVFQNDDEEEEVRIGRYSAGVYLEAKGEVEFESLDEFLKLLEKLKTNAGLLFE